MTKVVLEGGQHCAEVTVFLDVGGETRVRGPGRRNRQEALKDCLELRKVAVKCTRDPSLFLVRKLSKELKDTVWTVKDLGGRLLENAEGPTPGFSLPPSMVAEAAATAGRRADDAERSADRKFKGIVKGKVVSPECIVEIADVHMAISKADKIEIVLRKSLSRFGPVMEVRPDACVDEDGFPVASVRFASAKAAETAMAKAKDGLLQLQGEGLVRLRQPAAAVAVWRRFPRGRTNAPELTEGPSKKKLRPNERFASKVPQEEVAADESERFWEAQHDVRGTPAPPPRKVEPPPPEPEPEPAKPEPAPLEADASEEDKEVFKYETEVAASMCALLEKPFSQQRKALKGIRLRWHPDKNPERAAMATRVFQFIQNHEAWLGHHNLA